MEHHDNTTPKMPDWMEGIHHQAFVDSLNHPEQVMPDSVPIEEYLEQERAVTIDAKTGLPNEVVFQQRLESLISGEIDGAVLLFDENDLKVVNDLMGGHDVGDWVLQETARLTHRNIANTDLAARLHGDEFGIILPNISRADLPDFLDRFVGIFKGGFDQEDHIIPTISIGAVHTDDMQTKGDRKFLRNCADYALYRAKELAKNKPRIKEGNAHLHTHYEARHESASYIFHPRDGAPSKMGDILKLLQQKAKPVA